MTKLNGYPRCFFLADFGRRSLPDCRSSESACRFVDTWVFVGTNPKEEPTTSGLPVRTKPSSGHNRIRHYQISGKYLRLLAGIWIAFARMFPVTGRIAYLRLGVT